MKRILFLFAAVALLAACLKDDYKGPYVTLSENLIGKWIIADKDGGPALTNEKLVYNFVSTGKAYISASLNALPGETAWMEQVEAAVDIQGDKMTITYFSAPDVVSLQEFTVTSINAKEFMADVKVTLTFDNGSEIVHEGPARFVKVDTDYSRKVLGLWEGRMVSDESEYDDGQEHRWEFKEDGTFDFYLKDSKGFWQKKDDEYADYFVSGNLLCTRWKNAGAAAENREWWEITAISDRGMVWTALRQKTNGNTYTAAFSMNKVNVPTQAEVESAIIGKWTNIEVDGDPVLTNDKSVFTFASTTKAYMSASLNGEFEVGNVWFDHAELDVDIQGNVVTLFHQLDDHSTMTTRMTVASIDENEMQVDTETTLTVDGEVKGVLHKFVVYESVKDRFETPIIGLWEGRMTSEKSEYGDDEYHRWEYHADGSYLYYVQDADGGWKVSDNESNEYFVDGRLLCTRWTEAGEEHYEWWEISSLQGGIMIWTALRADEEGDSYVAAFSMWQVK